MLILLHVPVYVVAGEHFVERLSTVFFPSDFLELLKYVEEKFGLTYNTLHRFFSGGEVEAGPLLEEALELLTLLKHNSHALPQVFFFAVLPRDFDDVASIIAGGASSMLVLSGEQTYELHGGFNRAQLVVGEAVRQLAAGEVLSLGNVTVKVFTRPAYEAVAGPLKTLVTVALIAIKGRLKLHSIGMREVSQRSAWDKLDSSHLTSLLGHNTENEQYRHSQ